jgi:hypothetical protein
MSMDIMGGTGRNKDKNQDILEFRNKAPSERNFLSPKDFLRKEADESSINMKSSSFVEEEFETENNN